MKKCPKCLKQKKTSEYNKDKYNKDGLCYLCRECKNKDKRSKRKQKIKRSLEFIENNYLPSGWICNDCSITDKPRGFFDWHHINKNTKKDLVSNLIANASELRLKEELDKCILLCPNCHRERHLEEGW